MFVEFLKTEPKFKDVFFPDIGQKVVKAETFYSQVRCGLMHETRTKKDWVIKADAIRYADKNPNRKKDITKETFILKGGGENIIFRNQLQDALENWFEQYKSDLRNPDEWHNDLRRFFARKLDHLFDRKKDDFDWWNE